MYNGSSSITDTRNSMNSSSSSSNRSGGGISNIEKLKLLKQRLDEYLVLSNDGFKDNKNSVFRVLEKTLDSVQDNLISYQCWCCAETYYNVCVVDKQSLLSFIYTFISKTVTSFEHSYVQLIPLVDNLKIYQNQNNQQQQQIVMKDIVKCNVKMLKILELTSKVYGDVQKKDEYKPYNVDSIYRLLNAMCQLSKKVKSIKDIHPTLNGVTSDQFDIGKQVEEIVKYMDTTLNNLKLIIPDQLFMIQDNTDNDKLVQYCQDLFQLFEYGIEVGHNNALNCYKGFQMIISTYQESILDKIDYRSILEKVMNQSLIYFDSLVKEFVTIGTNQFGKQLDDTFQKKSRLYKFFTKMVLPILIDGFVKYFTTDTIEKVMDFVIQSLSKSPKPYRDSLDKYEAICHIEYNCIQLVKEIFMKLLGGRSKNGVEMVLNVFLPLKQYTQSKKEMEPLFTKKTGESLLNDLSSNSSEKLTLLLTIFNNIEQLEGLDDTFKFDLFRLSMDLKSISMDYNYTGDMELLLESHVNLFDNIQFHNVEPILYFINYSLSTNPSHFKQYIFTLWSIIITNLYESDHSILISIFKLIGNISNRILNSYQDLINLSNLFIPMLNLDAIQQDIYKQTQNDIKNQLISSIIYFTALSKSYKSGTNISHYVKQQIQEQILPNAFQTIQQFTKPFEQNQFEIMEYNIVLLYSISNLELPFAQKTLYISHLLRLIQEISTINHQLLGSVPNYIYLILSNYSSLISSKQLLELLTLTIQFSSSTLLDCKLSITLFLQSLAINSSDYTKQMDQSILIQKLQIIYQNLFKKPSTLLANQLKLSLHYMKSYFNDINITLSLIPSDNDLRKSFINDGSWFAIQQLPTLEETIQHHNLIIHSSILSYLSNTNTRILQNQQQQQTINSGSNNNSNIKTQMDLIYNQNMINQQQRNFYNNNMNGYGRHNGNNSNNQDVNTLWDNIRKNLFQLKSTLESDNPGPISDKQNLKNEFQSLAKEMHNLGDLL